MSTSRFLLPWSCFPRPCHLSIVATLCTDIYALIITLVQFHNLLQVTAVYITDNSNFFLLTKTIAWMVGMPQLSIDGPCTCHD